MPKREGVVHSQTPVRLRRTEHSFHVNRAIMDGGR